MAEARISMPSDLFIALIPFVILISLHYADGANLVTVVTIPTVFKIPLALVPTGSKTGY